jgi:dATP pyrophosphohydrolase
VSDCGCAVTKISADIVDSYLFRINNGMVQFLLIQRQRGIPMGGTWHGIHGRIDPEETALESAKRAVYFSTGLSVDKSYSADYINQFFDPDSDTIILAPVFAFTVAPAARVSLSEEYVDYAWFDTEEATARLLFAGQRWAVRHIEEIIGLAGDDAEHYRIR